MYEKWLGAAVFSLPAAFFLFVSHQLRRKGQQWIAESEAHLRTGRDKVVWPQFDGQVTGHELKIVKDPEDGQFYVSVQTRCEWQAQGKLHSQLVRVPALKVSQHTFRKNTDPALLALLNEAKAKAFALFPVGSTVALTWDPDEAKHAYVAGTVQGYTSHTENRGSGTLLLTLSVVALVIGLALLALPLLILLA